MLPLIENLHKLRNLNGIAPMGFLAQRLLYPSPGIGERPEPLPK
jgi:hypothetical protein